MIDFLMKLNPFQLHKGEETESKLEYVEVNLLMTKAESVTAVTA